MNSKVMKKILIIFILFSVTMACSSDSDGMGEEMNSGENTLEAPKGDFVSDTHPTSGMVSVNEDQSILTLTNFKTDDGPKLLLYLSTDVDSKEFVDLGDLKGIEGDFNYEIPANTDLATYKFVVVWCVDFSVSFGHAELK